MPPIGQCTGCRRWLPLSTSRFSPLPHSGCYRPPLTHYLIGYYRCGWVASGGFWFWRLVLKRNCRLDGLDPVITRDVSTAIQLVLVFAGAATAPSSRATLSLLSSLCSHFKIIIFLFSFFFFLSLEPLVSYYLTGFRVLVVFCWQLGWLSAWNTLCLMMAPQQCLAPPKTC